MDWANQTINASTNPTTTKNEFFTQRLASRNSTRNQSNFSQYHNNSPTITNKLRLIKSSKTDRKRNHKTIMNKEETNENKNLMFRNIKHDKNSLN